MVGFGSKLIDAQSAAEQKAEELKATPQAVTQYIQNRFRTLSLNTGPTGPVLTEQQRVAIKNCTFVFENLCRVKEIGCAVKVDLDTTARDTQGRVLGTLETKKNQSVPFEYTPVSATNEKRRIVIAGQSTDFHLVPSAIARALKA